VADRGRVHRGRGDDREQVRDLRERLGRRAHRLVDLAADELELEAPVAAGQRAAVPRAEQAFLDRLAPAFTELAETAEHSLYVDGAARLLSEHRFQDLSQINELMTILERRVALLDLLRAALSERDVFVRIGSENELPALQSLALVAAGYGLPSRKLGTVSLIGPVRMDYAFAIRTVREAALQLSRFIEDVYEG